MMRNVKRLAVLLATSVCVAAAGSLSAADEQSDSRYRAQAHTELGAAYFGRGQMSVALDELNAAIRADSGYAPAYNVRGLVYMELREDDKAEENFRRALSLDAADSDARNNYGWFLCQRGRIDDSIRHFMVALKNPLYATPEKPYLNAGICARKKNDDKGAEAYFLESLKLQPQLPQALFNLADIYYKRGNYGDAKEFITLFSRSAAQTAESLWLGVRIERKLGNLNAEASYGLQLRKMFPDSNEARALRGGQYD